MGIPLIGLSLDQDDVVPGEASETAGRFFLKRSYVAAVVQSGGAPLLLPSCADEAILHRCIEPLDALVVTGGNFDIPPDFYGVSDLSGARRLIPERSHFELKLLRLAWERRLPVLGVCGGMQLMNVFRGGTLLAHVDGHEGCEHELKIAPATLLQQIVQCDHCTVPSTHHQAIGRLADDLLPSAIAADGTIEAIELKKPGLEQSFFLGVQWHPEAAPVSHPEQLKIYKRLVEEAQKRART